MKKVKTERKIGRKTQKKRKKVLKKNTKKIWKVAKTYRAK